MNCDEIVELVTAYLDGALDAETEQKVEEHLSLCDGCTAYYDQVRATVAAVHELPDPDGLSAARRQRLLDAFRGTV